MIRRSERKKERKKERIEVKNAKGHRIIKIWAQNEIGGENESMTQKIIRSRSMLKYERTKYNHNIIKNNIIKFCDNNIILIRFNITNNI